MTQTPTFNTYRVKCLAAFETAHRSEITQAIQMGSTLLKEWRATSGLIIDARTRMIRNDIRNLTALLNEQ